MTRTLRRSVGVATMSLALVLAPSLTPATAEAAPVGPVAGGTTITLPKPEAPTGTTFEKIGAGDLSSLGLGADGYVYAWGANGSGEGGTGETGRILVPERTLLPEGVKFSSLAVGTFTSYAVGDDGKSYSWGSGATGLLGDGTSASRSIPGPIKVPEGVEFSRIVASTEYAFGLDAAGNAYGWGYNIYGQLGNGGYAYIVNEPKPVTMPVGVTFTELSSLGDHTLAVGSDGNTYAWGDNSSGLLGSSSGSNSSSTPKRVTLPSGVKYRKVAGGWDFSVGLGDNGKLYSWGGNYLGALGQGTTVSSRRTPALVKTPAGVQFTDVISGGKHTIALTTDGDIWGWGGNTYGELGNGSLNPDGESTPVRVEAPEGTKFISIAAGIGTSFALADNGVTYSWGQNTYGQLGDGTYESTSVPTPVLPPVVPVTVTDVTFGGVSGTNLVDNGDGTISVTAPPADTYGAVDLVLSWNAYDEAQTPVTIEDGFVYGDPPTLTPLVNVSGVLGDVATFTTETTGGPPPTLRWEVQFADSDEWQPLTADADATVSAGGAEVQVLVNALHQHAQYRVIATNEHGEIVSEPAAIQIAEYRVEFDSRAGESSTQAVLAGALAEEPTAPSRKGYTFQGWQDASGTVFDFTTPILHDVKLEAHWKKNVGPGDGGTETPTGPLVPGTGKPSPGNGHGSNAAAGLSVTGDVLTPLLAAVAIALSAAGGLVLWGRRTRSGGSR
ncbi:RCC1 domain-containing protein [Leucobacter sp. 1207-22]|uniref:RCC1 domain-containing protein n=1 Tax=Leucobacter sp. 1207-22 TaxID=2604456 RepID=UPI0040646D49